MISKMRLVWQKILDKTQTHGRELTIFFGMIGVAVCGFEFGFIQGVRHTSSPIVIEKAVAANDAATPSSNPDRSPDASATLEPNVSTTTPPGNCPFVGSRNSDKYHAAGCAVVKRIKPENRVCFASEDDARSKHYQPGCLKP